MFIHILQTEISRPLDWDQRSSNCTLVKIMVTPYRLVKNFGVWCGSLLRIFLYCYILLLFPQNDKVSLIFQNNYVFWSHVVFKNILVLEKNYLCSRTVYYRPLSCNIHVTAVLVLLCKVLPWERYFNDR